VQQIKLTWLLAPAVSAADVVTRCRLLLLPPPPPSSALLLLQFREEVRAFDNGSVWDLDTLMSPYLNTLQLYCEGE
jgi:hypothetical protein